MVEQVKQRYAQNNAGLRDVVLTEETIDEETRQQLVTFVEGLDREFEEESKALKKMAEKDIPGVIQREEEGRYAYTTLLEQMHPSQPVQPREKSPLKASVPPAITRISPSASPKRQTKDGGSGVILAKEELKDIAEIKNNIKSKMLSKLNDI